MVGPSPDEQAEDERAEDELVELYATVPRAVASRAQSRAARVSERRAAAVACCRSRVLPHGRAVHSSAVAHAAARMREAASRLAADAASRPLAHASRAACTIMLCCACSVDRT